MKGLVIWAHSYCRSVLAFYRGLGKAWNVPLKIYIWKKNATLRTKIGFTEDEFSDLNITFVGNDYKLAKNALYEHKECHHIFCAYQTVKIYQDLILEAKKINCKIGVASEAPCNMHHGIKRILKHIYIQNILPHKIKNIAECADFIINFSGDETKLLEKIGWKKNKIVKSGYYSPAIIGSKCIQRNEEHWKNFKILLTGIHQWHRSPMLLLKAINILNKKGIIIECDITQKGPLYNKMQTYIEKHKLKNVHLLGFLPMEELIKKYEECSIYVGAGNNEPWGIRLNDALMCGAPLIINKGMGGHKLINDYNCGFTFNTNDYKKLADILESIITNKELYLDIANEAYKASKKIDPKYKAIEIASTIKEKYPNWD